MLIKNKKNKRKEERKDGKKRKVVKTRGRGQGVAFDSGGFGQQQLALNFTHKRNTKTATLAILILQKRPMRDNHTDRGLFKLVAPLSKMPLKASVS